MLAILRKPKKKKGDTILSPTHYIISRKKKVLKILFRGTADITVHLNMKSCRVSGKGLGMGNILDLLLVRETI